MKGYTYDLDKAKAELAQVKEPIAADHDRHAAGLQPDRAGGRRCCRTAPQDRHRDQDRIGEPWPVVSSACRSRDKNSDMVPLWISTYYADPNNWIGEMYGSRYIGTLKSSLLQGPRGGRAARRGARDHRPGRSARVLYEKAATQGGRARRWASGSTTPSGSAPTPRTSSGIRFSPIGNGQEMRWAYYKYAKSWSLPDREPPAAQIGAPEAAVEEPLDAPSRDDPVATGLVRADAAGLVVIVFLISRVIPADPVRVLAGENATPAQIEAMRVKLGFDRPLPVQFAGTSRDIVRATSASASSASGRSSEDLRAPPAGHHRADPGGDDRCRSCSAFRSA